MAQTIQITKQTSLFDEILNKNGKEVNVSYYVKNTPFLITLSSNVSLSKSKVEMEVVYFDDHRPVVVPFNQLDFIVHKTKEDTKSIVLEVRLHVLSSQLENAIFTLCITVDGFAQKIYSSACKVVSKHDQIKRRQEKAGANPEQEVRTTPAKRKRSGGEEVIGNLEEIKETMNQQTQMMQQVLVLLQQNQQQIQLAPVVVPAEPATHKQTLNKRRKINETNNTDLTGGKELLQSIEIEELKQQLLKANKRVLELEVEVETLKLQNQNLQQTSQIFEKINTEMMMDMDHQQSTNDEWGSVGSIHGGGDSETDSSN